MQPPRRVLVDHEEPPAARVTLAAEGLGRSRRVALGAVGREPRVRLHDMRQSLRPLVTTFAGRTRPSGFTIAALCRVRALEAR